MVRRKKPQNQEQSRQFEPKLEWCHQGNWPKWQRPPLEALWQKPKSTIASEACFFEIMHAAVERFFQLTPTERLRELIVYLERQEKKTDKQVAKRLW